MIRLLCHTHTRVHMHTHKKTPNQNTSPCLQNEAGNLEITGLVWSLHSWKATVKMTLGIQVHQMPLNMRVTWPDLGHRKIHLETRKQGTEERLGWKQRVVSLVIIQGDIMFRVA